MESADAAFGSRVNLDPVQFMAFASKVTSGINSLVVFGSVATFPKNRTVGNEKFQVMGARGVLQQVVVEALTKLEACSTSSNRICIVDKPQLGVFALTGTLTPFRKLEFLRFVTVSACDTSVH